MNYGKKGLPIDIPEGIEVDVIRKKDMPVIGEPEEAVRSAIENPVGCDNLQEIIKDGTKICILVCDVTRPVPHGVILPVLIKALINAGARPELITILIATGLHRPNEGDELRELIGDDWIMQTVKVENHYAKRDEDHVFLGTTPRGMQVKLDRRFVDADMRIAVGLVEPHFMAGYSGGRKLIVPGVSHHETIRALHSARMLNSENVNNCIIEGNPLHEEQIVVVKMVGGALALNTVIDEGRRLCFVNFGEIEKSHLDAVSFARPFFEIPVKQKYRTIITSAAGYPLDRYFYQTIKGMLGVIDILETGGDLFIVSECSEGLGSEEYIESQRKLQGVGVDRFMEEASRNVYASIDEWGPVMQIKVMKIGTIHLYSECLTAEEKALTCVRVCDSISDSIKDSVEVKGDHLIAVIPEGPYVIPVYRPDCT